MKRLIPILLALFAILTTGVICCNRAVINTATDRMYDDVAASHPVASSPKSSHAKQVPHLPSGSNICVKIDTEG